MRLNTANQPKQFLHLIALLAIMAGGVRAVKAQTYSFQPPQQPLQQLVDVSLSVSGKVKMKSARFGVIDQNVQVTGKQVYEQWMTYQRATRLCRAVRYYRNLQSNVSIGDGQVSPVLRKNRKLIVDQYQLDDHRLYSPQGKLTRDELDLVDIQLSPTVMYQLLPEIPVQPGDTWKLDSSDLSAILALDAVAQNDVTVTLKSVNNQQAIMTCQGDVAGGANGVLTQIQLTMQATYDLPTHSFTQVSLEMTERREIGHAKPGLDVRVKMAVSAEPLTSFRTLTNTIIQKCDRPVTQQDELITLTPVANSIELELSRDWHVMMDQPELLVMRQVVRGDLVSQCSLSRLQPLSNGKRMSVDLLQEQIQKSLGEKLAEFTDAEDQLLHGKYPHTRIVAVGLVGEVTFQWIYHHVTDSDGNQYLFVFTIPNDQISQFGLQDRQIIESFVFRAEASDEQPVPAAAAAGTTKR